MASLQSPTLREPMLRAPAGVLWLIGAMVAAHLARLCLVPEQSNMLIAEYAFIPARISARYSAAFLSVYGFDPGSYWDRAVPFVSHMFLHEGFMHLGINCLWLLAMGSVVARRWRTLLFIAFFLICGIAGAVTLLVLDWGSLVPAIGASGAVSGLMGAAIRMMPAQEPFGLSPRVSLAPLLSRPVLIFTSVWTAINLVMGLTSFGANLAGAAIAWQAHLGGYFAGLLLAGVFDRLRPQVVLTT